MGCGKSSVGKKLSTLLSGMCAEGSTEGRVYHIDLDDYIVERDGRTITEIFAQDSEAGFRAIETKCLCEVLDWADGLDVDCGILPEQIPDVLVLSLGGGAVLKNSELLHKRTFCIYLKATVDTLVKRLTGNSSKRPLLASEPEDNLRNKIESILAAREDLYEKTAHMTILTEGLSVYGSAAKIIELINAR